MTDSGGPQRRAPCFLSTLLSQKVPEKSDIVLHCIVSGQPKPEVTWYKNGQAVDACGGTSSYEFFENQYIHVLHLSCCTRNDAAVYQISAKNCSGMICCSASIEVECSLENPQLSPNLKDDRNTGWKYETEASEGKSTNGIDKKEHPFKEADSVSPGAPTPFDSCPLKFNCLRSLQLSASNDTSAASSEAPSDVNGTKQTEQAEDPNTTEETADGSLLLHSSNTPEKQDVCHHRPAHSKVPRLVGGGLSNDSPNDEALYSSHQSPKVQKYISFSQPLSEATACISPGDSARVNKQLGPQVSSKDTDGDYELCPEITLTYMEEFSDDDLEYLECSDVMTDYTNAVWQRNLQGTEHVFLLESDDEEMEFSEHGLGGCGHFLSEMGCGPRVSDDTESMGATTGFCGYHSRPQEVGTRNSRACMHGPLSSQTGMTLTLGPHQDGTSTVTEQGRYKLPASSEAAENDYPGIQGDRDSHQAGEEFSSDHLLNMDKAATETQRKPLSGELEKSGMSQFLEMAEKREGEKGLWSKRGLQTPARGRRPGIKGKPKKLNANLKESATASSLNLLRPKGLAKHPLTRSGERETPHAKAGAADWNSHFHAGECAPSTQAEQEVETLQTPTDSLPKAGDAGFKGEGMQVNNLFETSQFPDPGNRPQVQIQEMVRERTCLSQMPAFSEPAGEESSFIGTTTNSFPNSGGTHEEHASLARYLEVESCTQGPQHEEKQDREYNTPSHCWEDLEHELSISEAKGGILSPGGLSAHLPQDASAGHRYPEALSVASTEHTDPALTLQNVCDGPRGREVACMMECFEAGDQGACCDATGPPVAAPADKYLPQEICSTDFTLAGVPSKAKYLAVSIAENNHADGAEESSPQAPEENIVQFPSNVQFGHILSGPTTKPTEDPLCMASSVPRAHSHVPQLPEGESFCSDSLLQIDSQTGDESQTRDRAANRSLKEHFQEKRSETKQRIQQKSLAHQGSLSADDSQESVPTTSPAQEEMNWVPLEHSPANSREERGQSSGLGMSVSMADEDSQGLSNVSSLSSVLLEESKENGLGHQEAGNKLKIITLEAPVSEIWPPRELTHSECKELEAGPIVPDRVWAVPDVLKADTAVPELDASGVATVAHSPQHESDSAPVNNREIHKGEELGRRAHWSSLSSQYLSQPRFLESSVDPIDEKALCVADSLPEASKTGRKEDVNNVSRGQGENQLKVDHPGFFKQFLTCPKILESSVDPIDETSLIECTGAGQQVPSECTQGVIGEGSKLNDGNLGQRVEVQPAVLQVPEETLPSESRSHRNQEDSERGAAKQSQHGEAEVEAHPAIWQVPCADGGRERTPGGCGINQIQEGTGRSLAEQSKKDKAGFTFPMSPLPRCLAMTTPESVVVDTHNSTGWIHDISENDLVEPPHHQDVFSDSKERGTIENKCGKHLTSSSDLTRLPSTSSLKRNITRISISHEVQEPKIEEPEIGETKLPSSSVSPTMTLAFISGECESEKASRLLQDLCQKCTLGCVKKPREKDRLSHLAAQTGKLPEAQPAVTGSKEVKKKQETSGSGHLAEGVKKKILSRVAALRVRLEEKENVRENSSFLKKIPKLETSLSCPDEKKDSKKSPCKREGKAPVLLKKIQAEMFPDHSGNVKLSCQFAEIHEDSTIWWTKDSKSIAQVQRSAGDNSTVSFAIAQASQKDQGHYYCCIKNSYGKVTAEFNLTAEVLRQLSSHQDVRGYEEIEFSQLIFKEDFLNDRYFGDRLHGQIATEELHFGEGVHRKAFRSKVMQGLMPVFQPGHACVLKVHNAIAHGTRNNDELIQRNYKLAAQECYVQNTARYYAKIYAAEAQPLEGFGEVPEIIPIFLIHRPENNIPYATVEEELIGEFVKYSIRDGKEINFLRRESEAGQKCCTFQHWVYQKTSGCLLVTDMQGVGMKLTDVGIATLGKGYKGFKGNCSMTFIDQFKALHQCNKYCKMLGLKSLQNNNQKQKKPGTGKSKVQTNSTTVGKTDSGTPAEKKT